MSLSTIQVNGQSFVLYLSKDEIAERIAELAEEVKKHYAGRQPIFLVLLNGAFVFAADLMRHFE